MVSQSRIEIYIFTYGPLAFQEIETTRLDQPKSRINPLLPGGTVYDVSNSEKVRPRSLSKSKPMDRNSTAIALDDRGTAEFGHFQLSSLLICKARISSTDAHKLVRANGEAYHS